MHNFCQFIKSHIHIVIPAVIFFTASLCITSCKQSEPYRRIEGYAQGGTFHIIYSPADSCGQKLRFSEDSIQTLVFDALRDIDFSISGYNKGSVLSRINRGEEVELDRHFKTLFTLSKDVWELSEGRFDITGEPLFSFWGFGFSNMTILDSIRNDAHTAGIIDSLMQYVGMEKVRIEGNRLIKDNPGIKLNFNAIAQGYSCDVLAAVLEDAGCTDYLVEVGMEMVCKGRNAKGRLWRIGIDAPIDGNMTAGGNLQDILELTDCGIVTSGNYRKFHIIDGKKYAHSIDPTTGYPVRHDLLSATVILSDTPYAGAIADAYATYCMVLGKEEAEAFIEKSDIQGYLIYDGGVKKILE